MDALDHPGLIIAARDSDNDGPPRRFAVCISDERDALVTISTRLPEQSCFPERPMTAEEIANLPLKPGEYLQL